MAALFSTVLADALLLHWAKLTIAISAASVGYTIAMGTALWMRFKLRAPVTRRQRVARDLVEGVIIFVGICLLGAIASYPLALESRGFVDGGLQRFDATVHFNWLYWYALVATHSWLQPPERAAYFSIYLTPAILIAYFAASGRRHEMRLFLASYWVAAILTLGFFPFLPAAGPLATLWHGSAPYIPVSALYQDQVIFGLKHHIVRTVDLGSLHGLVCAPSFHSVSAVLYIAAGWRIPRVRWFIAALNGAMLLATPIEGTHYLIDVVMGMLVAVAALLVTPFLIRITDSGSLPRKRRQNMPLPAR